MKQAGADLGKAQPELGLAINLPLLEPERLFLDDGRVFISGVVGRSSKNFENFKNEVS